MVTPPLRQWILSLKDTNSLINGKLKTGYKQILKDNEEVKTTFRLDRIEENLKNIYSF